MLKIYPEKPYPHAVAFCKRFLSDKVPRYVLGRNEYAASIANLLEINGFIDEFTSESLYLGKPILKRVEDLPRDSVVVSAVVLGRPLIALSKLKERDIDCLDYFSFSKYSGLALREIEVLHEGKGDIAENLDKYQWLYNQLVDETSKYVLERLLNFRVSCDLAYMMGFEHAPDQQYFEDFLNLKPGEVFVDAGGFDGQTAINFIRRCPDYKSIHLFEPDINNISIARDNLSGYRNILFYTIGLAESERILRFSSGDGAASRVSEAGDIDILVDSIDNLIEQPISMIKMDIEGAEGIALEGARRHILEDHPKLAICCYHKYDDLWKIPRQVLTIRNDYSIYLRHYTEGTTETVMYFIPTA